MHVYVWEDVNEMKLPVGMHLHHIDHDKGNNEPSNLMLITPSEHLKYHANGEFKGQQLAKEWHNSTEGHNHHVQNGITTASSWKVKEYVCEYCGNPFSVKSPRTDYKFCSNKCKSAYRRELGVDNEDRTCVVCGATFTTNKYNKTICCSRQCSASLRRNKKN